MAQRKKLPQLLMTVAVVVLFASPALATTFVKQKFVCPIGGEKFEANVVASNSTFGQRPDGKPYSPLPVYPIVECPQNGFLLFDEEFTSDELQQLRIAVESAEFQAMRATDTPHYRAYWLKEKVGREPLQKIWSLTQAGWETDQDWDRKVRYKAALIAEITSLKRTEDNADSWFWYNLRAANALRELGYYGKADALLDRVYQTDQIPADEDNAKNAAFFVEELRALIAEENPVVEPANLVPSEIAAFRCVVPHSVLSSSELKACESKEIIDAIESVTAKDGGQKLNGSAAIKYIKSKREVAE